MVRKTNIIGTAALDRFADRVLGDDERYGKVLIVPTGAETAYGVLQPTFRVYYQDREEKPENEVPTNA